MQRVPSEIDYTNSNKRSLYMDTNPAGRIRHLLQTIGETLLPKPHYLYNCSLRLCVSAKACAPLDADLVRAVGCWITPFARPPAARPAVSWQRRPAARSTAAAGKVPQPPAHQDHVNSYSHRRAIRECLMPDQGIPAMQAHASPRYGSSKQRHLVWMKPTGHMAKQERAFLTTAARVGAGVFFTTICCCLTTGVADFLTTVCSSARWAVVLGRRLAAVQPASVRRPAFRATCLHAAVIRPYSAGRDAPSTCKLEKDGSGLSAQCKQ